MVYEYRAHLLDAFRGLVKVTETRLPAPRLQLMRRAELPAFECGIPRSPDIGHTPAFCPTTEVNVREHISLMFVIALVSVVQDCTWGRSFAILNNT